MNKVRIAIAALSLSAAGFGALIVEHEQYVETAVIPTKNDRPTNGFGSTFDENGNPIQLGDKTTPVKAITRSLSHIAKDETRLKQCVTGPLTQLEYDILVDFAYQYGTYTACNSAMVRHINAGQYEDSCKAYSLYKFSGGYDCSTMIDGKPNKRCWGVWTRSLKRRDRCLEGLQ